MGTFTDGFLISIARALDLDEAEFEPCLRAERHEEVILGDFQDGATRGVNSTPTIFINGQMLRGLRSFEEYQQVIEAELEAVQAE